MLLTKRKPRFSWRRVPAADVSSPFVAGSKLVYALSYGEKVPGVVFSPDGNHWWFRAEDGRDSRMNGELGLTFTQARKALTAHARYMLGLQTSRR